MRIPRLKVVIGGTVCDKLLSQVHGYIKFVASCWLVEHCPRESISLYCEQNLMMRLIEGPGCFSPLTENKVSLCPCSYNPTIDVTDSIPATMTRALHKVLN